MVAAQADIRAVAGLTGCADLFTPPTHNCISAFLAGGVTALFNFWDFVVTASFAASDTTRFSEREGLVTSDPVMDLPSELVAADAMKAARTLDSAGTFFCMVHSLRR